MASKKILVQLDIQAASNLTSPLSGFVGFSAKADGLYQKIGTAPELRLLTSADVQNAILADGSITGAVSQAQIFTMGVKLYNLTQGYVPYASGATKLLSNSPIYTDGTSVGIGTVSPDSKLTVMGSDIQVDRSYRFRFTAGYGYPRSSIGSNNGNDIIFYNATDNEIVRFMSSGNVGIGTIAPQTQLHIYSGNANAIQWGLMTNNQANLVNVGYGTGIKFKVSQDQNSEESAKWAGITGVTEDAWGRKVGLGFYVQPNATDGTAPVEKVRIDENGNVGIGTPAPNQQLEITQNFRLPSTTGTTPYGIIYKDGNRFIHDFNYGNNGTVTTIGRNTFVGLNAGNLTMGSTATYNYEASYNTGIGYQSLHSNTIGNSNTANGYQSLFSNITGYNNTANGVASLYNNTTGYSNTAFGMYTLRENKTGNNSVAIGHESQRYANNTTTPWSNFNTSVGFQALRGGTDASLNTGNYNSAFGYQSLLNNTTGLYNTANGHQSLYYNTTGGANTANGLHSLYFNTTGSNNTALGVNAGRYLANGTTGRSTGEYGLYLGYNSKASADGTVNEIVVGYNAIGVGSNKTVIGNSSVTDTYFGSSTGSSKLWASALNLSSLTASKVVFTDSSKNLTSTGIGTASQFIKGDGSLDSNTYITSGSISGFVPYTGANDDVNLGTHNLSCNEISTASSLIVGKINTGYSDGGLFRIISPGTNYSQFYFYSIDTLDEYGVVEITANPEEGISLTARSNDNSSNSTLEIRNDDFGFYTNSLKRLEIAQSGSINAFGNTITSTGGFIGNASTATKLQTARTITIGNQSLPFDGTANISYTLSGIGIPVGTASQYFRGDLSLATFPTIHTGSGVDGRITFWNGTNSLSSSANLTWDNTNSRLSVNSISLSNSFKLGTSTTAGYVLTTDANGNGTWQAPIVAGSYTLPTATASVLGGVKIGSGITISSGVISVSTNYQAPITTGTTAQYLRGDLSLAMFPTIHTGSGVNGRITFWDGTNSLSSSANLTWDNTNSRIITFSIYSTYSFKLGSSTTAGYVLTTDANGNGTWQAPGGSITGSGVDSRLTFWSGTNSLSSTSSLGWNDTTKNLGVTGGIVANSVSASISVSTNSLLTNSFSLIATTTAGYVLTTDAYGNGTWQAPTGGGSYTLPTATASVLGGVKIGSGITISSGVISVSTNYQAPITTGTTAQYLRGDLSLATFPTIHIGNGFDGGVTFWNGTNSLSSTTDLQWNSTTKNLGVTGSVMANVVSSNSMSTNALSTQSFKLGSSATAGYVLTTDANGNGTWQVPPTGGGSYTLPTATASVLGGVKIGSGITISSGTISIVSSIYNQYASAQTANAWINGYIRLGENLVLSTNNKSLTGYLTNGTEHQIIGFNSSDKISVDNDGYGSVFGGTITAKSNIYINGASTDTLGSALHIYDRYSNTLQEVISIGYYYDYVCINRLGYDRTSVMIGAISAPSDLYVTGRTKTNNLVISQSPTLGYYLRCSDVGGEATWSQIPVYKGTWNAATNTPTLSNTGSAGRYYLCTTAGTFNSVYYNVGDNVYYNGDEWVKISG